jgi:hypothetical protein
MIQHACEVCGRSIVTGDDTYLEALYRHHVCRACQCEFERHYAQQARARSDAEAAWSGRERTCPRCAVRFRSGRERGACPSCAHVFYASHPEAGDRHWWYDEAASRCNEDARRSDDKGG